MVIGVWSLLLRFKSFSPYVGLGVGLFSAELKAKSEGEVSFWDSSTEEWVESSLKGSDSPRVTKVINIALPL